MASAEHDSVLTSTSYVLYPPNYFKRGLDSSIFHKLEVPMAISILIILLLASFGTSQFNQTILFYYDTYCQEFARDALTESNTCNLNAWSDVHSASYNFTCGADYYVAFAVYDSSNPLGMICSSGVNPIYNSSIEANACLSLDGNNGLQYINLAEVACAPRNVTNPGPPNSSSSTSSTPSTLSATSTSPTPRTSSTSTTISTSKGGSQTSTQSSAGPTQSASGGGGGGLDLSDRIALGVGIGVGVGLGLPAAIVAVWQLKNIWMRRTPLREENMLGASG